MAFNLFFKNQIGNIPNLDQEFKSAREKIQTKGNDGRSVADIIFTKCVKECDKNLICENKFINSLIISIFEKSIRRAIKSSFRDHVHTERTVAIAKLFKRLEGPRKLEELETKIKKGEERLRELEVRKKRCEGELRVTVREDNNKKNITCCFVTLTNIADKELNKWEENFNEKVKFFLDNTKDKKRRIEELNSAIAQLEEAEKQKEQLPKTKDEVTKIGIEIGSLQKEVQSLQGEVVTLYEKIYGKIKLKNKEEAFSKDTIPLSEKDAIQLSETDRFRVLENCDKKEAFSKDTIPLSEKDAIQLSETDRFRVLENCDKIREILIRNGVLVDSKDEKCYGKEIDLINAAKNSKNVIASVNSVCFEGG